MKFIDWCFINKVSAYRTFYALCVILLVSVLLSVNKREASQVEVAQAKLKAIGQIDLRKDFDVDRLNVIPEREFHQMSLESHPIDIDWPGLEEIRVNGKGILEFNSPLKRFSIRVTQVIENQGGGFSIRGNIEGESGSMFLGTVHDDAFVASFNSPRDGFQDFAIAMNSLGGHEIQRQGLDQFPICKGSVTPPKALSSEDPGNDPDDEKPLVSADELPDQDGNTVIDVMVVYTEEARRDRGSKVAMIAAANQAVNWANVAFDNSDVDLSFRLVHVDEISYSESGSSSTDLSNLQDARVLPEVHELRDAHGADIVSLWTDGDYGGLGNLGALNQWTDGRFAFNVCSSSTKFGSSKIYSIFTHECGHNLGCGHARDQDEEAGPSDTFPEYGAGWRWTDGNNKEWRTLMAYRPGERTQHFSNPEVNYNGIPTGNETNNNARVLKEMMNQVANYRDSVYYEFRLEDDSVTIVSYNKLASGVVEIPKTIQGKPVTQIADEAFKGCALVTGVIIPESVESIGDSAFSGCSRLVDIEFLGDAPELGSSVFVGLSNNAWITYPQDGEGFQNPFGGLRAKPEGASPPVFNDQDFELAELSAIGTIVGRFLVSDDDDDSLSFSITENADPNEDGNSVFSIVGDRLIVADSDDVDFEFGENILVTVQVTDGVFFVNAEVNVNLIELESQIALSRISIPQNSVPFSVVGTLSVPESDSENLRYNLVTLTDPEPSELIVFSDEWLYLDDGSDQGIAWRDNEFNDEDWLSGDSPLGYGVFGSRSPETVIGFGDDSNNKHPTAYFRNSFVIDDPLLVESLVMDLEVDDGAIVYINGTEVLRFRADGVGSYDDYASQIAGGADIAEVASQFVLRDNLSSVLREGFNVIAVEVHQANGTSSDTWLNMSLSANLRIPGLSDADHFYISGDQLFLNKSVIEAGRSEGGSFNLQIESVDELNNEYTGQIVINVGPSSKSPPDSITLEGQSFLEQQASGQVIGVLSGTDPEGDSLTFAVFPNPDYRDNQFFTVNGNELVSIASVDFDEVTEFLILVTAIDSGGLKYSEEFKIDVTRFEQAPTDIILESNVVDISAESGDLIGELRAIDPNEGQKHLFEIGPWPLEIGVPIIPFGSSWSFLDDGSDQGSAWRILNYDDSDWKVGVAQLGYGDGDEATVVGFVDTDPFTAGVQKNATTYFRHVFEVDEVSNDGYLFRVVYDDAVIIYINGATVAGSESLPIDTQFDTFSQATSNDNETSAFLTIPSELINVGENIIAVEIHQANATSSDMSFDFELVPLIGVSYQDYFMVQGNELKVMGDISDLGIDPPFTFEVPVTAIDPVAGSISKFVSVVLGSTDTDDDGWDDETEALFGSSPDNDESTPAFEIKINNVDSEEAEIMFPGEKGTTYALQKSSDLENWVTLKKLIIGQGTAVRETLPVGDGLGFIRIIKQ